MAEFAGRKPIPARTVIAGIILGSVAIASDFWPLRMLAVLTLTLGTIQRFAPESKLVRFLWRRRGLPAKKITPKALITPSGAASLARTKRLAVKLSQDIIDGNLRIIQGCRRLNKLDDAHGPLRSEPEFNLFEKITVDSNGFPLSDPEGLWDPEAIRKKSAEAEAFENLHRKEVIAACESIVSRWKEPRPAASGEPAIKIAGFRLRVFGRQFERSDDYYDGNWLYVRAQCGDAGATITVDGHIVLVQDIVGFGRELQMVYRGEAKKASLNPCEPNLHVEVEATDSLGHLTMRVDITPNHMTQAHRMEFSIDQSYLPEVIAQCEELAEQFPVRGADR